MRRPALSDLEEAAEALRNASQGAFDRVPADMVAEHRDALSRVATWLFWYAHDSEDRAEARRVGCTVKYLRKIRKEQSKE